MRLINTKTLCLEWFMGSTVPKYAILSHTWENEEVSFEDMTAISGYRLHPLAKQTGFEKIVKTCQKALENGILYAWYQKAEVCFAFLYDFDLGSVTIEDNLHQCRWFTRGWCLQELIAPKALEFYDVHWNHVGSRAKLRAQISRITRIDEQVLINNTLIDSIPVARKMSWAAERVTTREEDMAYCLLGIFDVNMPMLYGEGPKAFQRLQEEVLKTSNDLSIFAFFHGSTNHRFGPRPGPAFDSSQPYCDLFATSPKDFLSCGNLEYSADIPWNNAVALTNKGLYFRRVRLQVDIRHGSYSMPLSCEDSESKPIRMYLRKVGPGLFARYDDYRSAEAASEMDLNDYENSMEVEEAYIIARVTSSTQSQLKEADEYAIYVSSYNLDLSKALQVLQRTPSSDRWDVSRLCFLTKGERSFAGYWKVFPSLVRSMVNEEGIRRPPLGHFYLAGGFRCPESSPGRQPWVRLYSLDEWRALEKEQGMFTNLSTSNVYSTSSQMVVGANSINPIVITATIGLETKEGKSRFNLELEFK